MALIVSDYLKSVTAIGNMAGNGISWNATGFFVHKRIDGEGNPRIFLITNKHVFKGKIEIYVQLLHKDDISKQTQVRLPLTGNNGSFLYKVHPDPEIDIAVLPMYNFRFSRDYSTSTIDIDTHAMDSDNLRSNGGTEGTLIYMVGYPMGLVNDEYIYPICRLGCIGRNTKTQIDSTKSFLADIQNFPGNSGSPVFTKPEIGQLENAKTISQSVLIGIVHSYSPYTEYLRNPNGDVMGIHFENSGLANVHPVEYIRDVINSIIGEKA